MNTFNYILHGIWLIVISYLLYAISIQTNKNSKDLQDDIISSEKTKRYCYVNVDTLNSKSLMVQILEKELNNKRTSYDNTLQSKVKKFQESYISFQNQAKYLTQQQVAEKQNEFILEEQDLASLGQKYEEKIFNLREINQNQIQEALSFALDSLNKVTDYDLIFGYNGYGELLYANDSLEVTNEILSILNTQYNKKKSK